MMALSISSMADLARAGGIVTDTTTTLQWQDDYRDNDFKVKSATWEDALKYCATLSLDGTNWRLPNTRELRTIVDRSIFNPAIYVDFLLKESQYYWSSTTIDDTKDYAWTTNFNRGDTWILPKTASRYVRCVR